MLSVGSANSQGLGHYSATVGKAQCVGSYALADGLVQNADQAWSIVLGGSALGSGAVNGASLETGGMSYAVKASGGRVTFKVAALAGWMMHGNLKAHALTGSENGDVFWSGSGGHETRLPVTADGTARSTGRRTGAGIGSRRHPEP
ncbi:MAG: hypothetical protein K6E40_16550 [Desulfovibrio sp.]|nr:hypothetical protein [Desulfovibrio sp.]